MSEIVVEKVAKAIAEAARYANPEDCSEVCARAASKTLLRYQRDFWRWLGCEPEADDVEEFARAHGISLEDET